MEYITAEGQFFDELKKGILKTHLKKDEITLTVFDFREGTITTAHYLKNGKLKLKLILKKYKPYKYFEDYLTKRVPDNLEKISKKTIYDYICKIGKETPEELWGFYLFSREIENDFSIPMIHVPYISDDEVAEQAIWDSIKESVLFRSSDFTIQYLGFEALLNFQKAFNKNGRNYIVTTYGIYNNRWDGIIEQVRKTRRKQKITDETLIDLSNAGVFYGEIGDFFEKTNPDIDYSQVPFKSIRQLFCFFTTSQYAYALARASEIIAYGSVVGHGKINPFWWGTEKGKFYKNMHMELITQAETVNDFYVNYLNFGEPHEDYLFMPYDPAYTCEFVSPVVLNKEVLALPAIQAETNAHYIFLSGIDYKLYNPEISFIKACDEKMTEVGQYDTSKKFVFHIFDFLEGKKRTVEGVRRDDGTIATVEKEPDGLNSFSAIDVARDYKQFQNESGELENYFVNQKFYLEGSKKYVLTINRFYSLVLLHINAAVPGIPRYPGTIKEICFFTHGTEKGPVIFNARSEKKYDPGLKAPVENLPERWFDPQTSDLGLPLFDLSDPLNKNTLAFRNALAADAVITMNGCNSNPVLLRLIKSIVESNEYKKGGLNAETLITLKNPGRELKQFLKRQISLKKDEQSTPLKWKYRMGDLLLFFRDKLKSSYMMGMAILVQKPVYGGLPGLNTYFIETEKGALMNVEPGFKKYFKFYARHFGFKDDREMLKKNRYIDNRNNWFEMDKTGGYAKYVHNFPWIEKDGLEGVNF